MNENLLKLYEIRTLLKYKARLILPFHCEDELDDIVHNNIIKMAERMEKGMFDTEKGNLSTWAGNVITNACIDITRHKKVAEKASIRLKTEEYGYIDHDTEKTNFSYKQLGLIIKTLPPKYYDIINEYYFSDKTFSEIGEEKQINFHTLKVQAFKARKLLKQKIEAYNKKSIEKINIYE